MADNSAAELALKGIRNPPKAVRYLRNKHPYGRQIGVNLSSRGLLGTNVFSREWDLLVVLDTCRVDALRMVAEEYSFIGDVGRICSVGGCSPEWMAGTFTKEYTDELRNTAYLAGNAYADFIFEAELDCAKWSGICPKDYFFTGHWNVAQKSALGRLEHLHRYIPDEKDDPLGHRYRTTPPQYITDRAITVGREFDFDRMILHYIHPHHKYTTNAKKEGREPYEYEANAWEYMRKGGSREIVFAAYLDHLRYVLDSIETLVENIDAETVAISADHGDAFGEYGTYKHGVGYLHPHVRFVPWALTSATDQGNHTPEFDIENSSSEHDVAETLQALGYRED